MSDRAAVRRSLESTDFDLVVVGGGVTGAGIARDAALRGLRVALLEKGDLARGTSSASSKLIHGGLRYLEQLELGLVREGVRERALLMRNAPHIARPLPFIFPVYRDSRAGPLKVWAGMLLYDALALFGNYRNHEMLRGRQVERLEPALLRKGLRAGTRYYDCLTDDARLAVETAVDAAARGAVIATHFEVTGFRRDAVGHVTGVKARDALAPGSAELEVKGRITFSSVGPWTDHLLGAVAPGRRFLRPTKGVHVVLPREQVPLTNALVLAGVRDRRVIFAIPWNERTYVGTTDTDDPGSPDSCEANAWDVAYLLETTNHYFPAARATPANVISTWAGLRPLLAADPTNPSDVSREHEILDVVPGLLAIAGGKLTTYRLMAEQCVDRAIVKLGVRGRAASAKACETETTPLPGAQDPDALADLGAAAARLARAHDLPPDVARQLTMSYGLRAPAVLEAGKRHGAGPERIVPDLGHSWAEVAHACESEFAQRLDDVLRRRTLVFLKDRDQGLGVAEKAAEVMGRVLGWDAARREAEVARYREQVAASRAYRAAPLEPAARETRPAPAGR